MSASNFFSHLSAMIQYLYYIALALFWLSCKCHRLWNLLCLLNLFGNMCSLPPIGERHSVFGHSKIPLSLFGLYSEIANLPRRTRWPFCIFIVSYCLQLLSEALSFARDRSVMFEMAQTLFSIRMRLYKLCFSRSTLDVSNSIFV